MNPLWSTREDGANLTGVVAERDDEVERLPSKFIDILRPLGADVGPHLLKRPDR